MNNLINLFNYQESEARKRRGMDDAAHAYGRNLLETAREIARDLAMNNPLRECHADAVGRELRRRGLPTSLGPAAGSLFKSKEWKFTGERIRSSRASNHAREIKVWQLIT